MREMARGFLDFFDFDLTDAGMRVRLGRDAPAALMELTRKAGALDDPSLLVCVYEGLSCIAEADSPFSCEIDGKVCPPELFYRMLDDLMLMASDSSFGSPGG